MKFNMILKTYNLNLNFFSRLELDDGLALCQGFWPFVLNMWACIIS
jgi:hypothetical protein